MFGLEKKKDDKNSKEFIFDLETDLKDPKKNKELKKHAEERVQKVKTVLRSGCEKDRFDQFGVLLHGYASLLKVIARFKA